MAPLGFCSKAREVVVTWSDRIFIGCYGFIKVGREGYNSGSSPGREESLGSLTEGGFGGFLKVAEGGLFESIDEGL